MVVYSLLPKNLSGNLNEWMSDASQSKFEEERECFVQQADAMEVAQVDGKLKGEAVVGQAITDAAGAHLAYKAYSELSTSYTWSIYT